MSNGKILLAEALILIVVSAALGLTANTWSPKAIKVVKNYFPRMRQAPDKADASEKTKTTAAPNGNATPANAQMQDDSTDDGPTLDHGLQTVSSKIAAAYAVDAAGGGGQIVLIDARSDAEYKEGHIPGALHVYHYEQDKYMPDVLPALEAAEIVVVYCGGGDCEDSIYLGTDLIYEYQLPYERVFLYEGGMEDWVAEGRDVRAGSKP